MQLLILGPLENQIKSAINNGMGGGGGSLDFSSFGGFFSSLSGMFGGGAGAGGAFDASSMSMDMFDSSMYAGFASGGSFDVGGSGSTDSQMVAFKATPGEHVRISPDRKIRRRQSPVVMKRRQAIRELHGSPQVRQGRGPNGQAIRN